MDENEPTLIAAARISPARSLGKRRSRKERQWAQKLELRDHERSKQVKLMARQSFPAALLLLCPPASLQPRLGSQGQLAHPPSSCSCSFFPLQSDPLHEAATDGDLVRMRALLRAGNALHRAAAAGHDAVITALAQAGADVDASDSRGMRPIDHAARHGHVDAIQALVLVGAAVDAPSAGGSTPLHVAATAGQPGAAAALVMAGASLEARNAAGQTAWDCAGDRVRRAMREPRAELGLAELPSQPSLLQW